MMSRDRWVILVVDDEERIRTLIGDQLETVGYEVILAASGDDAFKILQGVTCIDLIVTDVRMPGAINGFDLVQKALADRPHLRTIIIRLYWRKHPTRRACRPLSTKTVHVTDFRKRSPKSVSRLT